jgi:hypothetical protein
MTTKVGASAAAAADQPLTLTGITTTKIAITRSAAVRRPASPRVVLLRCRTYSAKGAATRMTAMIPRRST